MGEIELRLLASQARRGRINFLQNPLENCRCSLSHQSQRVRCRVAQTVGFFSPEPCLDAEMEASADAFSYPEIRWALKDLSNPKILWPVIFWADRCAPRRLCILQSRPGLGAESGAVPEPPAPRFLENPDSAMLISARFKARNETLPERKGNMSALCVLRSRAARSGSAGKRLLR